MIKERVKEGMDNIGDTRIKVYSNGDKYKQTFVACIQCGLGRWQALSHGKSNRPICRKCSTTNNWKNPEIKEKRVQGLIKAWEKPEMEKVKKLRSESMSGNRNPFYGKKPSQKVIDALSKPRVNINVTHSKDWGYFIGLVLGDGCIVKTKKNYKVVVGSTRPELIDVFYECCNNLKVHCIKCDRPYRDHHEYDAEVVSKKLYLWLNPYKDSDFHFTIPEMVYRHTNMLRGFLQGFFDAEGGVYKHRETVNAFSIECWSKHIENLAQVKELLDILGIRSYLHKEKKKNITSRLFICNYQDRVKFKELVGFRIKRKQDVLDSMEEPKYKCHSLDKYKIALLLRQKGLTYKEISERINVARDTITGWCLRKKPSILGMQQRLEINNQEIQELCT